MVCSWKGQGTLRAPSPPLPPPLPHPLTEISELVVGIPAFKDRQEEEEVELEQRRSSRRVIIITSESKSFYMIIRGGQEEPCCTADHDQMQPHDHAKMIESLESSSTSRNRSRSRRRRWIRPSSSASLFFLLLVLLLSTVQTGSAWTPRGSRKLQAIQDKELAAESVVSSSSASTSERQQQQSQDQQDHQERTKLDFPNPNRHSNRRGGPAGDKSRRDLSGLGSSPPQCNSKCGFCTPCKAVHVPIQPGLVRTTEYYPEAWRCKCGNRLYMP